MNVRIFWVRAMECMCAQTRFMLLSERVFQGMESEPMLIPRETSPLLEAQRRIEPPTLHHAGQQAQHTTNWAIPPPPPPLPQVSCDKNNHVFTVILKILASGWSKETTMFLHVMYENKLDHNTCEMVCDVNGNVRRWECTSTNSSNSTFQSCRMNVFPARRVRYCP